MEEENTNRTQLANIFANIENMMVKMEQRIHKEYKEKISALSKEKNSKTKEKASKLNDRRKSDPGLNGKNKYSKRVEN
jgi:hypothetical protein